MKQIILSLLFVFAYNLPAQTQDCNLSVAGHVEDFDTKEKLANALVTIVELGRELTTDYKGDFKFSGLCKGVYTLRIFHEHCGTIEQTIQILENRHLDIQLPHARKTLNPVVLESRKPILSSGMQKELGGKNLEQTRGLSLSDALAKLTGVTLLQTGSTISKPVVHGLHSSRLLLVNNGVRQEGQQWGNEHAPEIDPFVAGKISVIKGVDELRYGSDAIGGVILVEGRPLPDSFGIKPELHTGYFLNNRQYYISGLVEQRLRKFSSIRYRLQGTFRRSANVKTPEYRLNNTAAREADISAMLNWTKKRFSTELFYNAFSTRLGIATASHVGNFTDLLNAINSDAPDKSFTGENSYSIARPYQEVYHDMIKSRSTLQLNKQTLTLLVAQQYNRRKEFDLLRNAGTSRPQLDLEVTTNSGEFFWQHDEYRHWKGTVGASITHQKNTYGGRYLIPNYKAITYGAYAIEKWRNHDWEFQIGLRYDAKTINTERLRFNSEGINYDFNFSTLASATNLIYNIKPNMKLNVTAGLSNRAPQVNELLSDGIHHGAATYERGNIFLKREQSLNFAAGLNWRSISNKVTASVYAYSNQIRNFIYQQPLPDAPVLTIAGAFPLIEYRQTDASLSGLDLDFGWRPTQRLEVQASYAMLYAWDKRADTWVIRMPPNRVSSQLTYSFPENKPFYERAISIEWIHSTEQTRVPDEKGGKVDYKAPPKGYHLVNGNLNMQTEIMRTRVNVSLGVRNLFNIRYREYLNSMRYFTDEMGRNLSLRLRFSIN